MNSKTQPSIQLNSSTHCFNRLLNRKKNIGSAGITLILTFVFLLFSIPREAHAASMTFTTDTTITEDAIIVAGEIWTINDGITLTIGEGVLVTIEKGGSLTVNSGTIKNSGTISNFEGSIRNSGTILNDSKGVILNSFEAIIDNFAGAVLLNSGFLNNLESTINNSKGGTIENSGTFRNSEGAVNNSGLINNTSEGIIDNNIGLIENKIEGAIANTGTINNREGSTINNSGTINNNGTINNCFEGNPGTITGTISGAPPIECQGDTPDLRFTPVADSTIKFNEPTVNFGANRRVQTDNNPIEDFLIKFDVSGIGIHQVQSAKLRLFCTNGSDKGGEFHPVDNDWSEETVTWENAPPTDSKVIASLGSVARQTWVEVDLTSSITEDGIYSLRVMASSRDGADYRSKEKPEFAPELVITLKDSFTFTPNADATIKLNSPTENFGEARRIETDNNPVENLLIKFEVSGIGTGTVKSAILRLFCIGSSNKGGDFHHTDDDWSEDTVIWNNAPLADREVIASLGPVVRQTWVEVNLSSLVTKDGVYSLRVISSSKDGADYRSKEKAGFEPELVLTVE